MTLLRIEEKDGTALRALEPEPFDWFIIEVARCFACNSSPVTARRLPPEKPGELGWRVACECGAPFGVAYIKSQPEIISRDQALVEARRRWGEHGSANIARIIGGRWLCQVGTSPPIGSTAERIYGEGVSWDEAFVDAENKR